MTASWHAGRFEVSDPLGLTNYDPIAGAGIDDEAGLAVERETTGRREAFVFGEARKAHGRRRGDPLAPVGGVDDEVLHSQQASAGRGADGADDLVVHSDQ